MKRKERFHLKLLNSQELAPFQAQLAEFESTFEYPLGEHQSFRISHGAHYAAFFDDIGDPLFAVLFEAEKIVAILAGIRKPISIGRRELSACYYGDFKIHPDYQRRGLSKYLQYAFVRRWAATPSMWFACHYGITMQKNQTNTILNMRNRWLFRRFSALGTVAIYFVSAGQVAHLKSCDAHELLPPSLDLSPQGSQRESKLLVSTKGKKDLLLTGSNEAMKLSHFTGHSLVGTEFLSSLKAASQEVTSADEHICFALDTRRAALIDHLAKSDVHSNASAAVYALPSIASLLRPQNVFVSTFEI